MVIMWLHLENKVIIVRFDSPLHSESGHKPDVLLVLKKSHVPEGSQGKRAIQFPSDAFGRAR